MQANSIFFPGRMFFFIFYTKRLNPVRSIRLHTAACKVTAFGLFCVGDPNWNFFVLCTILVQALMALHIKKSVPLTFFFAKNLQMSEKICIFAGAKIIAPFPVAVFHV